MNLPNERNQTQKTTDCAVNVFDIWKRQDQSNGEKKSVCQEFGLEGWGSGQRAGLERNRMTEFGRMIVPYPDDDGLYQSLCICQNS